MQGWLYWACWKDCGSAVFANYSHVLAETKTSKLKTSSIWNWHKLHRLGQQRFTGVHDMGTFLVASQKCALKIRRSAASQRSPIRFHESIAAWPTTPPPPCPSALPVACAHQIFRLLANSTRPLAVRLQTCLTTDKRKLKSNRSKRPPRAKPLPPTHTALHCTLTPPIAAPGTTTSNSIHRPIFRLSSCASTPPTLARASLTVVKLPLPRTNRRQHQLLPTHPRHNGDHRNTRR